MPHLYPARRLAAVGLLLLSACAADSPTSFTSASMGQTSLSDLPRQFAATDRSDVRTRIAGALRDDPRNGDLHFLQGLSYHLDAGSGDAAAGELAQVGYQSAVRFAPTNAWAHYFQGVLHLERRNAPAAMEAFAVAAAGEPDRPEPFLGLASAAYMTGDLSVAQPAADRARALASKDRAPVRLATLIAAARADTPKVEEGMRALAVLSDDRAEQDYMRRRIGELHRSALFFAEPTEQPTRNEPRPTRLAAAGFMSAIFGDSDPFAGSTAASLFSGSNSITTPSNREPVAPLQQNAEGANQVMIEVTIILNSDQTTEAIGLNLLDGLQLQYGYENRSLDRSGSGAGGSSFLRTVTSVLSVPTINYNLNIFNEAGRRYQVLARPTLTGYIGRESEFFAGRTISVQVSGVNLGSLQPIDIGVNLRVTPERITPDKTIFRVAAGRSFLSQEAAGTFQQSLTTFKQSVSATAEVQFGQTLVLSGLSENVLDAQRSRVPGLGEIPGINLLFSRRSQLERQESVLILITPVAATQFDSSTRDPQRGRQVQRLVEMWNSLIDPNADLSSILRGADRIKALHRPSDGDVSLAALRSPATVQLATQRTAQALSYAHR